MAHPLISRLLCLCTLLLATAPVSAAEYGERVLDYCSRMWLGKAGSGECAHLATEALRYAGAEFTRNGLSDAPSTGDYVWGTRVKRLDWNGSRVVDSAPGNKCKRGDILQYRLGAGSTKTHHTSIVAEVNSQGYPTLIYQQNYDGQRYVTQDNTDLFAKLKSKGGYIQAYRAIAPVANTRTEFTLRNSSTSASIAYSVNTSSSVMGQADTRNGYSTWYWSGSPVKLTVGGATYNLSHRSAYEFYTSGGKVLLRKLSY